MANTPNIPGKEWDYIEQTESNGDVIVFIRVRSLLARGWPRERIELLAHTLAATQALAKEANSEKAVCSALALIERGLEILAKTKGPVIDV